MCSAHGLPLAKRAARQCRGLTCNTKQMCCLCRHFFLDAALLMRGRPREHLLQAWTGILQQQQEDGLPLHPDKQEQFRVRADALWNACESATLVSSRTIERDSYVRLIFASCLINLLGLGSRCQAAHILSEICCVNLLFVQ